MTSFLYDFQAGEKMYKMIGNIPDRDMAMLEERIKRQSKSRPPPGSSNGQASEPQPPPEPVVRPQEVSRPNSGLPKPGMNRNIPGPAAGSGIGGGLAAMRRNYQQLQQQQQQQQQEQPQPRFAPKSSPGRDRPMSGAFTLDPEITGT